MTTRPLASLMVVLLALVVASGAAFRLAEYAGDRSLWLDEAMLYRNVHTQSLGELAAGRLVGDQCAPAGFLLATRVVMAIAGDSEYALRFLPQLAAWAMLIALAVLAKRRIGGVGMVTAVALAAWSWPLVYYSNEFKQYSSDALVALLLFALALSVLGRPFTFRCAIKVGVAGLVALAFSQPVFFLLAALGTAGWIGSARRRQWAEVSRWSVAGFAWVALFAGQMWLGYDSILGNDALIAYHREVFLWPWTWDQITGALDQGVLASWISATSPEVYWAWALLVVFGAWAAWRADWREAVFIGGAVGFTLLASLLGFYPLAVRLLLFLLPLLFWLAGRAVGWLAGLNRGHAAPIAGIIAALLLFPLLRDSLAEARHPIHLEHLRPVLARVAVAAQPDDVILVWGPTGPAFDYYWPRVSHPFVPAHTLKLGPDEPVSAPAIAAQVAPLVAGRSRVWLVITHDNLGASRANLTGVVQALLHAYPPPSDLALPGSTAHALLFAQPVAPTHSPTAIPLGGPG